MAMTLAEDYYEGDLDDVAHRLLPREILADVGIFCAAPSSSCAARRRGDDHAAVVEGILGLDTARKHPRQHSQHVHVQGRRAGTGNGVGASAAVGGGQYQGGAARHAPPASFWNGTTPCPPKFEMAAAVNSHPSARCHGTGVFLPRVEAYGQQNREFSTSYSPNPRKGAKPVMVARCGSNSSSCCICAQWWRKCSGRGRRWPRRSNSMPAPQSRRRSNGLTDMSINYWSYAVCTEENKIG